MTLTPPVKVGAAEVYFSGTVICRPGQIVEITPVPSAPMPYRLKLSFVEDTSSEARAVARNEPNNVVIVTFTNLGSLASTIAPLDIGNVEGTPLLLDVAAYNTGEGAGLVRVVTYTVLKGRP